MNAGTAWDILVALGSEHDPIKSISVCPHCKKKTGEIRETTPSEVLGDLRHDADIDGLVIEFAAAPDPRSRAAADGQVTVRRRGSFRSMITERTRSK